jgi:carbamate kinase
MDKDLSAELLASRLGANALLLLTDVPGIYADWPDPRRRLIRALPPGLLAELALDPGSMGPKARAAHRCAATPGRLAVIGDLEDAERMLRRETGTIVSAEAQQQIEER